MSDWSVHVVDAATGEVLLSQDADVVRRTASVGKVLVLTALAEALESGAVDAGEVLSRRTTPPVADSGLWHLLEVDQLPVGDVATLIGAVSDNLATNVLVDRLGLGVVQAVAPREGLVDTQLWDVVRDERTAADPPTLSTGTAREWTTAWARLHQGTWVSPQVSRRVLGWLSTGVDHSLVAAAFALDPLLAAGPLVNKTGSDDGVRCDVGLVTGPGRTAAYACLVDTGDTGDVGEPGASMDDAVARMRALGEQLRRLVA